MKALVLAVACALLLASCGDSEAKQYASQLTGGDADRGKKAIDKYGCGTCHRIPGINGADGSVGPSLSGISDRTYIAGKLPNTPDNLKKWIQHPQKVTPGTVMPEMGVTEHDVRDIAAYLYTLQ